MASLHDPQRDWMSFIEAACAPSSAVPAAPPPPEAARPVSRWHRRQQPTAGAIGGAACQWQQRAAVPAAVQLLPPAQGMAEHSGWFDDGSTALLSVDGQPRAVLRGGTSMLSPLYARPIAWLSCARANAADLCCLRCQSCLSDSRTLFVIVGGWQAVWPAWRVALIWFLLRVELGLLPSDGPASRQQPQRWGA